MIGKHFHNYKDYGILLLLAILSYWPISFMVFSAKGDAINYFLAMRYNSSEAIQNGYFPYWTAYINMGYPMHGDIQSGVWNPIVLLMSLIRQFDIYWLHTEIILINFIAGVGMYKLLRYFGFERKTLLLIASAYMLNGYITDAGQFLNWLYAAAFLPFVFLYLLRCFKTFSLKDAFLLGLAHSLMFLCAYPADTILLTYIIIAFGVVSFIQKTKDTGWRALKMHLFVSGAALVTFFIICLPALISFAEFIPLINRGGGISVEFAMTNSLAPPNLLSVVMPWPTMRGTAFAATDPLIRNCYMGILTLIFLLQYFFKRQKKDLVQKFLVGTFLVFLVFSLGKYGGLRLISYHVLPLMDSFRHPANAKLFFMFAGQVLAAFAINRFILTERPAISLIRKISIGILVFTSIALIVSILKNNIIEQIFTAGKGNQLFSELVKNTKDRLSFYDLMLLNSLFILGITGAVYLLIRKEKLKKFFIPLMFIDLFITAQLMLPLTYVKKTSVADVQSILDKQPKGYPIPDSHVSLAELSMNGESQFEKIGCLNPYNKKPGRSDYIITPSNTADHDHFWEYQSFRNKIMSYPLAHFVDTLFALKDTQLFIADIHPRRSAVADILSNTKSVPGNRFKTRGNESENTSVEVTGQQFGWEYRYPGPDSLLGQKNANNIDSLKNTSEIKIIRFSPGNFEFETDRMTAGHFILLQNYYPRWQVQVNGQPGTIYKSNLSFMGVNVPAGKNTIRFYYNGGKLAWLGLFSVIFVFLGFIYFYFMRRVKKPLI